MARFQQGSINVILDGVAVPDTDYAAANKLYVDTEIAQLDATLRRIIHEDTDLHAGRGLEKTAGLGDSSLSVVRSVHITARLICSRRLDRHGHVAIWSILLIRIAGLISLVLRKAHIQLTIRLHRR